MDPLDKADIRALALTWLSYGELFDLALEKRRAEQGDYAGSFYEAPMQAFPWRGCE